MNNAIDRLTAEQTYELKQELQAARTLVANNEELDPLIEEIFFIAEANKNDNSASVFEGYLLGLIRGRLFEQTKRKEN